MPQSVPAQRSVPELPVAQTSTQPAIMGGNVGGVLPFQSVQAMQEQMRRDSQQALQAEQSQPVIAGLAAHVKAFFLRSQEARRPVERAMIEALYARRGQYTAEKKKEIEDNGQPPIYMMLASVKMRQAESLIRDVVIGTGSEKPWTAQPTPLPELPPEEVSRIREEVTSEVQQAIMAGFEPDMAAIRERLEAAKEQLIERIRESARTHCVRAEDKMEDQLVEGGFNEALDQWITDLTTFKTAFIAGPIVRRKAALAWVPGQSEPQVEEKLTLEWERVDPFAVFPAPFATSLYDGSDLARLHKLTRQALTELIGVEGYSEDAIRQVLEQFGDQGLHDWLTSDSERAQAEGKTASAMQESGHISALQHWGSVSGKMLREWGLKAEQVPDEAKEYQAEVWVIGPYVIKAAINPDPLGRRVVFGSSYERIPGSFWGHSVYDLMRDCQDMCNAAARSLAANMAIASGPQVAINVARMPPGEDVTQLFPWKIHQFESDPMGSTAPPIIFFQPGSNADELMRVYERFSILADEYTGIPKYMTGTEGTPGAGRTASGLSMMISNASKIIKQVVANIDANLLTPLLERLYYYNMRYGEDPDLKGDLRIVARGALSLVTKETAQVRRNEFLAATNNPVDLQIVGIDGRAELLRQAAKALDINPDKVVPPVAVLKDRAKAQLMQQQQQMAQQGPQGQQGAPGGPTPNNQQLMNGAPVVDAFQPAAAAA